MTFNYYHTNFVIPNLILANKKFFIETILPNPNNMQIFIEKESYKLALKGFQGGVAIKPKIKNITANRVKGRFIVYVEFDENYVEEDADNFAIAISIAKDEIRFFTYEKGTSAVTKEDLYFVGEFELKENEVGAHKNYGTTSEYKISYFAGRIEEILEPIEKKKEE